MDPSLQKLPNGDWNYSLSPFFEPPRPILALTATTTFALLTLSHVTLGLRHKTKYMIPLIIGCILETLGYIYRYMSIQDPFDATKFVVQYVSVIIAPILVTTSLYTLLEKVMHASHPSVAPFRNASWVFVGVEVVTFFVQVVGAGIASAPDAGEGVQKVGSWVMVGGIGLQLGSFCVYLGIAWVFYARARDLEVVGCVAALNPHWRKVFNVLVLASGVVLVRSVFRLVEFVIGYDGPIAKNELYLYGFDFLLMAISCFCLVLVHPGRILGNGAGTPSTTELHYFTERAI
ncbi:RTA1-domain-containing protein [Rhizoclosmatium globosum]|uniref:RTA1-domain-containing protein n=1 Tax=Rhizoclosmatium globosum TaxID=329046 RepID=A0A1Y2CDF1_9FUNG|nr:RTA1-domain-containing protein [Rhizoclosmatium globosum]|eukprot:ORY45081.1 RTA1-domain-containing protein [Rhizoclosmatium globosum]